MGASWASYVRKAFSHVVAIFVLSLDSVRMTQENMSWVLMTLRSDDVHAYMTGIQYHII